jgi:hypothetical protein
MDTVTVMTFLEQRWLPQKGWYESTAFFQGPPYSFPGVHLPLDNFESIEQKEEERKLFDMAGNPLCSVAEIHQNLHVTARLNLGSRPKFRVFSGM